jgi:hypothetical protein
MNLVTSPARNRTEAIGLMIYTRAQTAVYHTLNKRFTRSGAWYPTVPIKYKRSSIGVHNMNKVPVVVARAVEDETNHEDKVAIVPPTVVLQPRAASRIIPFDLNDSDSDSDESDEEVVNAFSAGVVEGDVPTLVRPIVVEVLVVHHIAFRLYAQ